MLSCSGETTSAMSSPALTVAPGSRFMWVTCTVYGSDMSRGRDGARTTEIDEERAEIDDEETKHTEYDCCIGNAHQSSGRAPAAFDGIGNVGIEAVDLDVHRTGSSNPSPQEGATNARRYEVIV